MKKHDKENQLANAMDQKQFFLISGVQSKLGVVNMEKQYMAK
ncbi:hypothetical protein [Neobacillus soli]|nr:hypothetical protein [Neobacillus soli]